LNRRAMIVAVVTVLAASPRVAIASEEHHHPDHHAGVDHRGDHGMGFSHEKTRHHFALTERGGVISADAADPKDTASRDGIRRHFRHIAMAFKKGDFAIPMFIHNRQPPGVPVMKKLAAEITYELEETPAGGRVVVHSVNAEAIRAIHEFLKFQITDHRTGDRLEIQK
jgi:hypothetical protein